MSEGGFQRRRRRQQTDVSAAKVLSGPIVSWILLALIGMAGAAFALTNGTNWLAVRGAKDDIAVRQSLGASFLGVSALGGSLGVESIFYMPLAPFMNGEELVMGGRGQATGHRLIYSHFKEESALQAQLLRNLRRTDAGVKYGGWQAELHLEGREPIKNGTLTIANATIDYSTQRAVFLESGRAEFNALVAVMGVACPDEETRILIWASPDSTGGGPLEPETLAGSAADPAAINTLIGRFNLCEGGL